MVDKELLFGETAWTKKRSVVIDFFAEKAESVSDVPRYRLQPRAVPDFGVHKSSRNAIRTIPQAIELDVN